MSYRNGNMRPGGETLAPLIEGPESEGFQSNSSNKKDGWGAFQQWMKGQLKGGNSSTHKKSNLYLQLGILGTPLAPLAISNEPLPHLSIKDTPIEASSAQYILQQYIAATGARLQESIKNSYTMGKVKMVTTEFESAAKVSKPTNLMKPETGGFVLWQMMPDMWYVELAVAGNKVRAGCNGKIVWRHSPCAGPCATRGPVRPLRRALQGLDPKSTASMFANAKCIGEKNFNGEDCFILKLSVDGEALASRSDSPADIIRHILFGYFSQRTGLLVYMEDSHLTRVQVMGGDVIYWETTVNSYIEDYRMVDGIMIAHSGKTSVTVFRFGEGAMSHTKTKLEETWTIEEVVFNVPGLSLDCFIPPADIAKCKSVYELPEEENGKLEPGGHRSRVVALDNILENFDNIIWKVEL